MNNNEQQDFELLDIITILGFGAQIKNMEEDGIERKYIHTVIKAIANEIQKLHQENDEIITLLKEIKNGFKHNI